MGYHVSSKKATKFRIWATQTVKEYILKGFVLNDDVLKNGRPFMHLCRKLRKIKSNRRQLSWYPETTFEVGIMKTIKWNLDNKEWMNNITSGEYQGYYKRMYEK